MTNKRIPDLTAATTPLAGTELVLVWDGSATVKVPVSSMFGSNVYTFLKTPSSANLAAAVTDETGSGALVFGTNPTFYNSGSGNPSANYTNSIFQDVLVNYFTAAGTVGAKLTLQFASNGGATNTNSIVSYGSAMGGGLDNAIEWGNASGKARVTTAGDVMATTGNFIPAVSGKGIDFSAVTPAAGMTSKVLTNYEEGTWTPDFSSWTVAPSYTAATYTRVGRVVHVFIQAAYGTIPIAAYIGGLPFVVGPAGGSFTGVDSANANITGFSYSGNSSFQNVTPMTLTGWWAMSGSYNI